MARYATDFSEYATGAEPPDFTRRYEANFTWLVEDDAGATGGKLIRGFSEASTARNGLSWNKIDSDPNRADTEIFMRARFPVSTADGEIMTMSRGSGTSGSANLYRHGWRPYAPEVSLAAYVAGSFTSVYSRSTDVPTDTGVFFNILTQTRGGNHKMKIWPEGSPEPVGWRLEDVNSAVTGVGWVGFFRFRPNAVDIDFFGVGTGADSAPRTLLTPSEILLTVPSAAKDGETSYTGAVNTDTSSGTLVHVVSTSTTKPSLLQIQAGQDHTGVAAEAFGSKAVIATGSQPVSGSGLTAGTTYYLHFQHASGGLDSEVVTSPGFTTDSVVIPALPTPINPSTNGITAKSAIFTWEKGV